MDRYDMLMAIQSADPDGGEIEPTEQAYESHKRWAIALFGEDVWLEYIQSNWEESYSSHYE